MLYSFIYPYYNDIKRLQIQINNWNQYSKETKNLIELIIVDDHSNEDNKASNIFSEINLPYKKLFYVHEDIPWNQHCARNIGVKEASAEWIFLNDIDHVLNPYMCNKCIFNHNISNINKLYYNFSRIYISDGQKINSPVNIFLLTKDNFWKVNGYDEDFCGTYGGDRQFLNSLRTIYNDDNIISMKDIVLEIIDNQTIRTHHNLNRIIYHEKFKKILNKKIIF